MIYSGKKQNTVAEFSLAVDLSYELRGTHMSRFIEVLNENPIIISIDQLNFKLLINVSTNYLVTSITNLNART